MTRDQETIQRAQDAADEYVKRPRAELPRVTVVLPSKALELEDSQSLMAAVLSVEGQDYPVGKVDLHLVLDTEGLPQSIEDLRRFGVEAADTEWVAFMSDTEVWEPDYLRGLVSRVVEFGGVATWRHLSDDVPLVTLKDIWLEGLK